jgi:hypothetical protein
MKQKLSHMYIKNKDGTQTPYDFTTGMTICNSQVALNSRYFCLGLTGEFDVTQALDDDKRVNDKNSVVGIYRFDERDNSVNIEYWINQVSVFSLMTTLFESCSTPSRTSMLTTT